MARDKAIRTAQAPGAPVHAADPDGAREIASTAQTPRAQSRHDAHMSAFLQSLEVALLRNAGGKVILFSSARAGEGKTRVVAELAAMLTHSGRHRVALVDAGPRHEAAAQFAAVPSIQLERALLSLKGVKLADFPRKADAPTAKTELLIATATAPDGDAPTVLQDPHTWTLLKSAYDYVLIDTPSLAESPLALAGARHAAGVVLVIESGRTRWQIVRNAQEQFERAGASMLGAFLNKRVFHVPRSLYNRL